MKQYIVDALTNTVFGGNPVGVCLLDEWLNRERMLSIAGSHHLIETAFVVKSGEDYELRWFTPGGEIELCVHSTWATAYVLMRFIEAGTDRIRFNTPSGLISVEQKEGLLEIDLPVYELYPIEITDRITEAIGVRPVEAYLGRGLLFVLESEEEVWRLNIDEEKVKGLDGLFLQVTARGKSHDCVSRSFSQKLNGFENSVIGSEYCHIVPYWSKRLGKSNLIAYQASPRGGFVYCEHQGSRIKVSERNLLYSIAMIHLNLDGLS